MGVDGYLFVLEQLLADGDVPPGAERSTARAQVTQKIGPLRASVQSRHVEGAQVMLKQPVSIYNTRAQRCGQNACGCELHHTFTYPTL